MRCIVVNVPWPGLKPEILQVAPFGISCRETGYFVEVVGNQIPISRTFVPTANSGSQLPVSGWLLGGVKG